MGSTSEDTQLQITLPRTTQGESPEAVPSMVINTSFLPALHYRVSQQGSHWSQSERGDCRPLIEPNDQNARGILHSQFPHSMVNKEGTP